MVRVPIGAALGAAALALFAQMPASAQDNAAAQAPAWPEALRAAIAADADLQNAAPADLAAFCPNAAALQSDKTSFWVALMSQIAAAESEGDATRTTWRAYDPAMRRPTFRRGLYQISIEAAHSDRFQCDAAHGSDLTDPETSVACGVRILHQTVLADGAIARDAHGDPAGAARYWPSLRNAARRQRIADALSHSAPCAPIESATP